jgi:hypothetical protein
MGSITSSVMPTYYGLAIILMLGGAVAAYVRNLRRRIGDQEKSLGEFRLYVAEQYASKEFMGELKREITDSIRELGRRIDHGFLHRAQLTRQQKGRDFSRPSKSHSAGYPGLLPLHRSECKGSLQNPPQVRAPRAAGS